MAQILDDITQGVSNIKNAVTGRMAGFAQQEGDFVNKYKNFINSQEGLPAMYERLGNELNLPTLRNNAQGLQNTLRNIPGTYTAATRGFDVNSNQLSRIIGSQQGKIAPLAQNAQTDVNAAEGTLNTRMGFAQADEARLEKPYTTEGNFLTERIARESTGYSQMDQTELTGILEKVRLGVQISESEKRRINELALREQDYEHAKQTGANKATQIVESGGKKLLIDSTTGQIIASFGSGGSGSSAASYFAPTSSSVDFNKYVVGR